MKKQRAAVVATVLLLLLALPATALAVSPGESVAADFDSSLTDSSTVVVAVADSSTEEGVAALAGANAIASAGDYTVIRVSPGELEYQIVETLSQRVEHDDLEHAIVVGYENDSTSDIATALTAVGATVGGEDKTLSVSTIEGDSTHDILRTATDREWSEADEVLLSTDDDRGLASLLVSNELAGAPVLDDGSSYSALNHSIGERLGANTVYVTPNVSESVIDDLEEDGYDVQVDVDDVALNQSLDEVAAEVASESIEDVAIVAPDNVHTASQIGVGANAGILVANSSNELGDAAEGALESMTAAGNVYVLGDSDDLSDSVLSDAASAAPSEASIDRVNRLGGDTEFYLRTSLLVAGYEYGVLASDVSPDGDQVTVDITNIGYSTVTTVDNASVTATWNEDAVASSNPDGEVDGDRWVVTNPDEMGPGETFSVTLDGDGDFENAGHPEMDYYVTLSSGGMVGTSSGTGFFVGTLEDGASWLYDGVDSVLPFVELDELSTFWMVVLLGSLGIIAATIVVLVRRELDDMGGVSSPDRFGIFVGFGPKNWLALIVGAGLIVWPEPITSGTGVLLVAYAFNLHERFL